MRNRYKVLLGLAVLCVVAVGSSGLAGKVPPSTSATATLADHDDQGNPYLLRSDGLGPYIGSKTLSDQIMPTGYWWLYIGGQRTRKLWLTLTPLSPTAPIVFNGLFYENGEVYSKCYQNDNVTEIPLTAFKAGEACDNCALGVVFSYAREKYKLIMTPNPGFPPGGTGLVTVTCNSQASAPSGSCNSWTIVPNTDPARNPFVAHLYQYTNAGLIWIGAYWNTFRIRVTVP